MDHRIGIILGDMQLQQVFYWTKKIHRFTMWFAILLGLPMIITGLILNKIIEGENYFVPLDPLLVRWFHGKVSEYFALALAVMMLTGFLMWIIPKILSNRAQSKIV